MNINIETQDGTAWLALPLTFVGMELDGQLTTEFKGLLRTLGTLGFGMVDFGPSDDKHVVVMLAQCDTKTEAMRITEEFIVAGEQGYES